MNPSSKHVPDCVLQEIFKNVLSVGYLTFPYAESRFDSPISSVCSQWRNVLSNSAKLWRRVFLRIPVDKPIPSDFYSTLYQMAPAIKHLMMKGSVGDDFTRVFLNFPTFPNVESLEFDVGPKLTPMEWALMVDLFPKLDKFTNYPRRHQTLGDRSLQLFAAGWPNLTAIDLSYCNKLTGAGLIDFVSVAKRLQKIDVNGIARLTDGDIDSITRQLSTSLKSIRYGKDQGNLTELVVQSIVRNCPQLEEIFIWTPYYNISPLKNLTNLKLLAITMFRADKCEGLEDIFSRPSRQLRFLEIENVTNVTDSLLTNVANGCPLLETLGLSMRDGYVNRSVTDLGLDQIVNKCRNLTHLDLERFPLLTGRSFIDCGAKLPQLRILCLKDCANLDADVVLAEFEDDEEIDIDVD